MYTIVYHVNLFDERPFFDPRSQDCQLEKPTMSREEGKLATLTFTIYPGHPEYGNLMLKKSELWLYSDGVLLIKFRPVSVHRAFAGGLQYQCEELLGLTADILYRPNAYGANLKAVDILGHIADTFNAQFTPATPLQVGTISRILNQKTMDEKYAITAYKPVYDVLKEFVESFADGEGLLVPRYDDDYIYLDYLLPEDLALSDQEIQFGENLVDLNMDSETDDFFTVLIPLGADVKTSSADRAKGQANKLPLTINRGGSSTIGDIPVIFGGDSILDVEYHALYGRIEKTVEFKDMKTEPDLYGKGVDYFIKHRGNITDAIEVRAADLRDAGVDVEHLRWMTRVHVSSPRQGIDQEYVLRRQVIQLDNPTSQEIIVGGSRSSLTDIVTANAGRANRQIGSLDNRVFGLENG